MFVNKAGKTIHTQKHYTGKDSLFDILKRIVRCRQKGNFKQDLQKTKDVINIYLKEFN